MFTASFFLYFTSTRLYNDVVMQCMLLNAKHARGTLKFECMYARTTCQQRQTHKPPGSATATGDSSYPWLYFPLMRLGRIKRPIAIRQGTFSRQEHEIKLQYKGCSHPHHNRITIGLLKGTHGN